MNRVTPERLESSTPGGMRWHSVLLAVLLAVASGSAVYFWHAADRDSVRRQFLRDQEELRQRLAQLQGCNAYLEQELSALQHLSLPGASAHNTDLLAVYEGDEQTYRARISFYVAAPKALPLIEKQRLLARRISDIRFGDLPIEVMRIELRDGKAIAIVNLRDRSDGFAWGTSFFQGSTGGFTTEVTLTYSLLQPDRAREWVDGVEFLYNGKPVGE